ncbi:unnamed protein product, partial [Mesorhabditis belari]|uniref:POP1 C-terminal domain-containing protein n=1 Tax=Mesorhabditis belari TaxID=2138241 RepID=A0AAF3F0E9_9BILA
MQRMASEIYELLVNTDNIIRKQVAVLPADYVNAAEERMPFSWDNYYMRTGDRPYWKRCLNTSSLEPKLTPIIGEDAAQKEDEEKVKAGYRTSANREICGRVVRGDFTFTESRGVGIGFLPIGSLAVIPKYKNKRVVLVRNTSSKFYRLATISILQTSTEI